VSTLHERLLRRLDGQRLSAPKLCAAVRAVVELHKPTDIGGGLAICEECDGRWAPCSTIKIIAAQLGVEIEETPK
jgi:hypothetical protein